MCLTLDSGPWNSFTSAHKEVAPSFSRLCGIPLYGGAKKGVSQPVPWQRHVVRLPSVAIINNVAVNNLMHPPCGSQGSISRGQIPGLGTLGQRVRAFVISMRSVAKWSFTEFGLI